jgi:hypothetical protein
LKSYFWEYSEDEGSFGGLFGLNIRLIIFLGLIGLKRGVFRISDLTSIICIIMLVIYHVDILHCMPRLLDPYLQICGIWIQGSGAAGYVASTTYFFEFIQKVSKEDSRLV